MLAKRECGLGGDVRYAATSELCAHAGARRRLSIAPRHAVSLSGTLKDIAAELGLTHEALYRTLADMSADGEIERRKGTIRLLKPGV